MKRHLRLIARHLGLICQILGCSVFVLITMVRFVDLLEGFSTRFHSLAALAELAIEEVGEVCAAFYELFALITAVSHPPTHGKVCLKCVCAAVENLQNVI